MKAARWCTTLLLSSRLLAGGEDLPALVRALGAEDPAKRDAAGKALEKAGPEAEPLLVEAERSKDLEIAVRAGRIRFLRLPLTPLKEISVLGAEAEGRRAACAGLVLATNWGDGEEDYRDWTLAPIHPDYDVESRGCLPIRLPQGTSLLLPHLHAETVVRGTLRWSPKERRLELEIAEAEPLVVPVEEKGIPVLTVRLAQHERDRRYETEAILVGRLGLGKAGTHEEGSYVLEEAAGGGWPSVEISPGRAGCAGATDLAPLVGRTVLLRGFLREARYVPTDTYYPYLRARAVREASEADLKRALDAPESAAPVPLKQGAPHGGGEEGDPRAKPRGAEDR